MENNRILSILETIPKNILIECAEKLFLKNKKFESLKNSPTKSKSSTKHLIKKMYSNSKEFRDDLIATYEAVLDLIKINGDSGIVNKKRQETYKKAIDVIKEQGQDLGNLDNLDITQFIKTISSFLTEKPKKLMKELYTKGEVTLEDKTPYNGATIKNGKIVGDTLNEIDAFKNLSGLIGIGIGIGDSGVKDLVRLGYTSIDQLKTIYEENKFANLRKGLQGPLIKYFEGTTRIEKMSREEATKWRDTLNNIINEVINEKINDPNFVIKHKIAGSYARNKQDIGDIDYVLVINHKNDPQKANIALYEIMNTVLDQLADVTDIGDLPVELDSVTETPSKPIKGKKYATFIKLWFKVGKLKTKVEIYGYSNAEFSFPYFARAGEVNLQKKIKLHALKRGYKLSPWSLDIKDTDTPIETIPEQVELIRKKLGKNKIETIKDLFNFLEFS